MNETKYVSIKRNYFHIFTNSEKLIYKKIWSLSSIHSFFSYFLLISYIYLFSFENVFLSFFSASFSFIR